MNEDSQVVDTGAVDAFGYPVYDSRVIGRARSCCASAALTPGRRRRFPQRAHQRLHLAALAYAYAVPERFQELVTRAFDLADTRIMAGMHSPIDVMGGRILATALAAATLNDPANAAAQGRRPGAGRGVPAGADRHHGGHALRVRAQR